MAEKHGRETWQRNMEATWKGRLKGDEGINFSLLRDSAAV
jgi:hypothetical protein